MHIQENYSMSGIAYEDIAKEVAVNGFSRPVCIFSEMRLESAYLMIG